MPRTLELASRAAPTALARTRPLVVELLGVAGSGKTTLLRQLDRREPSIRTRVTPRISDSMSCFLSDLLPLWPRLYRACPRSRWFRWYEARCMLRLRTWQRQLHRLSERECNAVLLDHGPIFKLVRLREFGPACTSSHHFRNWWQQVFQDWTSVLDMVVWLDAPDHVLWDRIQQRPSPHRTKRASTQAAFQFLNRYRDGYRQIVDHWEQTGEVHVLRCNTWRESVDQTVDTILASLAARRAHRSIAGPGPENSKP